MSWDISLPVRGHQQGYTELNTTPHTRRVKTVFFAMRHALDDMEARQECMDIMRELFRQFMSILIQEKTRVEAGCPREPGKPYEKGAQGFCVPRPSYLFPGNRSLFLLRLRLRLLPSSYGCLH